MNVNDLKKTGVIIEYNNEPYQVVLSQHSKTARGQSFIRTKIKNLVNGQVLEKTFSQGDKIKQADIEKAKASFLYKENNKFFFMNNENYEQFFLEEKLLTNKKNFLKDGISVDILIFNKEAVAIDLPKKINLKVIEAPPGIKGDSATSPSKTIILETGLKINAPIFIKVGDVVRVNTETGQYVERV